MGFGLAKRLGSPETRRWRDPSVLAGAVKFEIPDGPRYFRFETAWKEEEFDAQTAIAAELRNVFGGDPRGVLVIWRRV